MLKWELQKKLFLLTIIVSANNNDMSARCLFLWI